MIFGAFCTWSGLSGQVRQAIQLASHHVGIAEIPDSLSHLHVANQDHEEQQAQDHSTRQQELGGEAPRPRTRGGLHGLAGH